MNQWHQWRAEGIGSSDAPVIMKLFPYGKTPYSLWEERVNKTITPSNPAMKHGMEMEERAISWFERRMGVDLFRNVQAEHNQINWMRATVDGIDMDDKVMVEIKSPYNLYNHYKTKQNQKVPDIYWPQVQHQLKVKELPGMYYLSYNHENEDDSVILEVERDDKYIEKLLKEEELFWKCLKTNTPPPLTEKDYVERDVIWHEIALQRLCIRDQTNDLKKKDKQLLDQMLILSENKSSCFEGVKFTTFLKRGSIDYETAIEEYISSLRESYPRLKIPDIDLESYRKESSRQWKLTGKGE